MCGWWQPGWAAKTLSPRYWGICVQIAVTDHGVAGTEAAVVQPPTVKNPSPSRWSDFKGLEELVPFPPSSLLSFSPFGSQVLRHSKANICVEEIRKSPRMARERHRFRKDLRPKVDTSAHRHPTITKTKASKPHEGEEYDFQGCYIVQWQCPILNNNKAQWIQKIRK